MSSTYSSELQALREQVTTLERRVTSLEQATKPTERASESGVFSAADERAWAETRARMNAIIEYQDLQREELYRENPSLLRASLEEEQRMNGFLRERGIRPTEGRASRIAQRLEEESK